MLQIFASTFMTATRQDGNRPETRPENPLRRVRTGGLTLPPKTGR